VNWAGVNWTGIRAIYVFEMKRTLRTLGQSILSPVITTVLYFVVFGGAIGGRIESVEGIDYGSFIVPGLVMLTLMQQAINNAAFGIYFPKFIGTIYELLSAPVNFVEIVIGYVGAAATKALGVAALILVTATFFVELTVQHPLAMVAFLLLTAVSFSLLGFILGIWAGNFEQLTLVPLLVVTPLVFLGGAFYSVSMLPEGWAQVTYFNPVLYLISGFRWSFFGVADVAPWVSLIAIAGFLLACMAVIWWIFRTGWRLKP
jgi:ABC-2 type transport system permease protein